MMNMLQMIPRGWHRFWFTPADPVVLSTMRVLVGGMLFYTHIVWGMNLRAFFGADGWNSPEVVRAMQEGMFSPSFWWYVPEHFMREVHVVCLSVLFLFWIGCFTRVTSILAFLITISYSYRAQMANYGLDQINGLLALYLCIGSSGALLSVDRCWKVYRAKRAARAAKQAFAIPPVPASASTCLAIRLIQLHFCVIYSFAGLSKLQGDAWWNGEAIWRAFSNLEYQSVDMTWTAWYPWISELATHTTIVWEVFFTVLIWVRPLRPLILFMGFFMHIGIGALMGMWTFGLVMIFGHLSFWSPNFLRRVLGRIPAAELLIGSAPPAPAGTQAKTDSSAPLDSSPHRRPALLWIDQQTDRRVSILQYFAGRGMPGVGSACTEEAVAVRDVTEPSAIVLMADSLTDETVDSFHRQHCARDNAEPLLVVTSPERSEQLADRYQSASVRLIRNEHGIEELQLAICAALSTLAEQNRKSTVAG